ncbi:DUF1735 and LamG domain-containing protein [uncultured Muribaculum sp.]|uniref:DUF1735 and LamG domain-containing protein n=1 Tax=uncultured Muribaculum sp. TaxID=1918613 RepID=UPI0025D03B02|nr:DUF1735 and LamG domain-containing protein [uncultured Muribaculum sp.]
MKLLKSIILAAPLALIAMTACNSEGDNFEYHKPQVYITGTDSSPIVKFKVDDTPASYALTASSTHKADGDIHVTFAYDPAALEAYNQKQGTTLAPLPADNFELSSSEGVIKAGGSFSDPVNVTITSTEGLDDAVTYVIPLSITNCSGSQILEPSKTVFLQLARTINFMSLDLSNYSMYAGMYFNEEFGFPEDKTIDLGASYTYEVKCYLNQFRSISRMMNFRGSNINGMFRFGEGGYPVNSLQWCGAGAGNHVLKYSFETNRWYMITLTYDGTQFTLYVDGEKDTEVASSNGANVFKGIELGMSWENYPSQQRFNGRIAEVRVWDRVLGAAEIKGSLCGVKADSPGLRAYWKFNEGEGHIFHDATGNGYDMDWSKSKREKKEGAGEVPTPEAADYVQWKKDANNKCAQ